MGSDCSKAMQQVCFDLEISTFRFGTKKVDVSSIFGVEKSSIMHKKYEHSCRDCC